MPLLTWLIVAAVCKSIIDRVFIIGLRGSEFEISFVLGVTMVVPTPLAEATTGAVGDTLVVVELSA